MNLYSSLPTSSCKLLLGNKVLLPFAFYQGWGSSSILPVLSEGRVEWYLGALNGKCQSLRPCECDLRPPCFFSDPGVCSSIAGGWPPHVLTLPTYQCR